MKNFCEIKAIFNKKIVTIIYLSEHLEHFSFLLELVDSHSINVTLNFYIKSINNEDKYSLPIRILLV